MMATSASRAMIATNAIFMALACVAVALRLHLRRKTKSAGPKADDWFIVGALVLRRVLLSINASAHCNTQVFSIALAVTNIVGVPVGGFGVPFTSLTDTEAQRYLKVRSHHDRQLASVLMGKVVRIHHSILVYFRRGSCQAFHLVSLRKTLLEGSISLDDKIVLGSQLGLAHFFLFCYFLPSVASSLQLGNLHTYYQLYCNVRMLQRDRHPAGYFYSMHPFLFHQDTPYQSKSEIWPHWYFRSWRLVCFGPWISPLPPR